MINVDETRWAIMGTAKPATGTVWGVHAPTVSYYRILPGKSVEEGVRYMLERWTGLTRFVENPRIPLDNNAAKRALRGPVVGRKNHYGSRSQRGTQVAALFYTLCETAKLVGVDPYAYLLRALHAAIAQPGAVTHPEDLLTPQPA